MAAIAALLDPDGWTKGRSEVAGLPLLALAAAMLRCARHSVAKLCLCSNGRSPFRSYLSALQPTTTAC